jgi:hypothetical protein
MAVTPGESDASDCGDLGHSTRRGRIFDRA